jgi:tetratricopeptide (TPR) repeat protein
MKYREEEEKAERCLKKGKFAQALSHCDLALTALPKGDARRYAQVGIYLGKARSYLGLKNAQAALDTLNLLAFKDPAGICQGYPEYFETLIICQKALGLDCRDAENRLSELRLDWRQARTKAQALLKSGKCEESLIYFERAIAGNPGEWYAVEALYRALKGKARALKKLGRRREAEACLKQIPEGK